MAGKAAKKGRDSVPALKPRRSSPRLPIRRLVIIACPEWKKYKEVYSKNIGRRSLMVIVPENPPPAKSPIAVWMGSDNLEKPRGWTKGHVVRLEPSAGGSDETGVVVHLTDPEAESIWCLIPRGDEDKLPLPRSTPRFRKVQEERKTINEKPETSAVPVSLKPAIELDRRPNQEPSAELPPPELPPPVPPPSPPKVPLKKATTPSKPQSEVEPFVVPPIDELLDRPDTEIQTPPPEATSATLTLDEPEIPPFQVPSPDELLERPDTEVEELRFEGTYRRTTSLGREAIDETIVQLDDVPTAEIDQGVAAETHAAMQEQRGSRAGVGKHPPQQAKPPPVPSPSPVSPNPAPGQTGMGAREPLPPAQPTHPPIRQSPPLLRQSQPTERQSQPPERQPRPASRPPRPPLKQAQASPMLTDAQEKTAARGGLQPLDVAPSKDRSKTPSTTRARRSKAPVVGIDFGTTYSKVAIYDNGEVILVEDTKSTSSTRASVPSVVAFQSGGRHVVGERAQELLAVDPTTVISSVKRAMGLKFSDPLANGILGSLSCGTLAGPNDTILFDVHGEHLTVPDVASRILGHMRTMASEFVGADVKEVVLTMPVDFDRKAKRELELAARMAGLDVKALIPEPVAAAMGCGYDGTGRAFVAVYDFGGGTFDSSIVEVGQDRFMVRGAAGDRWLGGDDFDELMARYVADQFQKQTRIGIHNRAEEWQRLLFACEEAKRWLSTLNSVDVVLPRAALTANGPKTLLVPVTRDIFNDLTQELVASTVEICAQSARQAGIHPKNIDSLLITGGSTRIPAIREAAQRLYKKQGAFGVHPQHAVVIGAAVRAAVISGAPVPEDFAQRLKGQGVVDRTIGLALSGGSTEHIIDSSQRAPVAAHRQYSTNRDNQTTIRLELVQGTSHQTNENQPVGGFVVEGLPPKKAGVINLDVYFELSTTGTLHVTAQERSSGQRAQGTFDLDIV